MPLKSDSGMVGSEVVTGPREGLSFGDQKFHLLILRMLTRWNCMSWAAGWPKDRTRCSIWTVKSGP